MKRVRISDESLNSYGSRVLTDGIDTGQYEKNPVLLYMHRRGEVIGFMKNLRKENGELTAEPVFDCASELSQRCKKQFEFGSLKMVSAGLSVLSLDRENVVQGQSRPTIAKSKLYEVSVVDVGANDNAIVLMGDDGQQLTLGEGGDCPLPLLDNIQQKQEPIKKEKEMELKTLALQLGLPEGADEAAVNKELLALQAAKSEVETLKKEKAALELSRIEGAVDAAVKQKLIGQEKKEQFVKLGGQIGFDELQNTFSAMSPQVRLSNVISAGSGSKPTEGEYKKLSDVPSVELAKMREENVDEYKRLYKAEYGIECEL